MLVGVNWAGCRERFVPCLRRLMNCFPIVTILFMESLKSSYDFLYTFFWLIPFTCINSFTLNKCQNIFMLNRDICLIILAAIFPNYFTCKIIISKNFTTYLFRFSTSFSSMDIKITPSSASRFLAIINLEYIMLHQSE